jgi:predicted nucleic acid-binding protein
VTSAVSGTFSWESPAIYPAWETLVVSHEVVGKSAHDVRIVAAMQVHGIRKILAFDRTGFSRYRGISVLSPSEVVAMRRNPIK